VRGRGADNWRERFKPRRPRAGAGHGGPLTLTRPTPPPSTLHSPPPPAKRSRKVTLEDLKAPDGLPELYATLPSRFRRLASGRRGEEGADLARLVDLYAAWGRRLAPGLAFPALLDSLEALGRTGAVKLELRELRAQALAPLERVGREAEEGDGEALVGGWLGGGSGGATAALAAAPVRPSSPPPAFIAGAGSGGDGGEEEEDGGDGPDDDELLELQAAPAAVPVRADAMDKDDDEAALVAMFEGGEEEEAAGAGAGPGPASAGETAPVPAPAPAAADAAPPKLPSATAVEEEELLAMFASQVEPAAPPPPPPGGGAAE